MLNLSKLRKKQRERLAKKLAVPPICAATHEAGHAVLHLHFGHRVLWVSMQQTCAEHQPADLPLEKMAASYGGALAEGLLLGVKNFEQALSATDIQAVEEAESQILDAGHWRQVANRLACKVIHQRADIIRKLAAVLMERGRLDEAEVLEIWGAHAG